MEKMVFKMSPEVLAKSIDIFSWNPNVYNYVKDMGCKTVEDVVDRQAEIPTQILTKIKGKLAFDLEL